MGVRIIHELERNRIFRVYQIVSIIKFLAILFCGIVIFNIYGVENLTNPVVSSQLDVMLFMCIIAFILIIMGHIWLRINNRQQTNEIPNLRDLGELIFFVLVFTVLIYLSGGEISQYKFLYIFAIIVATIQFGTKYGINIGIISSALLLILNLVSVNQGPINDVLQADFVLIGIFLLTAWLIGDYVAVEKTYRNQMANYIKRLEETTEALRENEASYKNLIELLPDGICVLRDEKIVFANKGLARLVGSKGEEELIGKRITDLIRINRVNETNSVIDNIDFVEKYGRVIPFVEQKMLDSQGLVLDIEMAAFPYPNPLDIEKSSVLLILRDLTEWKRAERDRLLLKETLDLDRVKNEFFANISHELKTPINVIFSAVQLLEFTGQRNMVNSEERKSKQYLKMMRQNCYRLIRLVNNLVDTTRIDSGFFKIYLSNENIVSIVEEITLSVVNYIEVKELTLEFDTNVEEKIITCDPDKIERIMLNLLSNAIKFSNPGGKISVNIYDQGDYLSIVVEDTGIGIPQEEINLIFERFQQVDKSFRRNCEGSGIGLSLVKSLVEIHGGRIGVTSKMGVGSKFIVDIPCGNIVKEVETFRERNDGQSIVEKINIEFSDIYF